MTRHSSTRSAPRLTAARITNGLACGLACLMTLFPATDAPAQECAYVGNQLIGTVRILSIPDGAEMGSTTLPDCSLGICQLTDIVVHPQTGTTYVSQLDGNRVWAIPAGPNPSPTTISVTSSPTDMALSPDGAELYVISLATAELVVIDTASGVESRRFGLPSQPRGLAVVDDGARLVTTSRDQNSAFVVDSADGSIEGSAEVGQQPIALAVSPDGAQAFIASEDGVLTIVDTATGSAVDTVSVGDLPSSVAVHPNGGFIYVANRGDDTVSVVDLAGPTVSSVDVGRSPVSAAASTDGLIVVSNLQSGSLSLIDSTNGNALLESVPAGVSPFALEVAPCSSASCAGDCNGDGNVSINELIIGVNVTLGLRDLEDCRAFDADQNGTVEIAELIRGVRNSLNGCPQ